MKIKTAWHTTRVDGTDMRLFAAYPKSRAPGIMVFQEAFGVNAHIRAVTAHIASLGYVAVAPELFHRTAPGFEGDYNDLGKSRPHMEALTADRFEDDIEATHTWLSTQPQVDACRIAAIGFCMGGKGSYIANAMLALKAAISFYGSSIPSILETYTHAQQGPLMLIWGGEDKHIDAPRRILISESLRIVGKTFRHVEFSDAGHGFCCKERDTYHPQAAEECWAMVTSFLRHALRPEK